MEEKNICSSLPDVTAAAFQQDSSPSLDHQFVNGGQQDAVSDDTEVCDTDFTLKAGRDSPEEAEPWEQVIWPVRPMACTSPLLSFATVQWDMPDTSAETPSAVTHSSLANELGCADVMSGGTTSPSLQPPEDGEDDLFREEVRETEERFESELLNEDSFEPCDAAGVQEATTQEEEESTPETSGCNNENVEEIPLRTDSEEEGEEEESDSFDPAVSLEIINSPKEDSEDEVNSLVDLKLEEEQEEPVVLLTEEGDSEEEQTLLNSIEAEETDEEGAELEEEKEEDPVEAEESEEVEADSCLNHVEVAVEPQQTDETGQTINTETLLDPEQAEVLKGEGQSSTEEDIELQEDSPTEQTEESEMCETVDQNQEPEQSEAAENIEEPSRAEDSEEILELTEKLQETSCSQDQVSEITSQDLESLPPPDEAESEQFEVTEETEQIQEEEQEEQSLMETETAELSEESTPSEQTVSAEDRRAAEQQTEPSEQNEQQTSDELLEQPEETNEPEIMEQLSPEPEVTQQPAKAELRQQDEEAEESHQAAQEEEEKEEGVKDNNVLTIVSNGVQHKPPDSAVAQVNGGEVDRESARRLAERLFRLDGIQRVEVVRHLDKDNAFSRAVGEEYLKFFNFTGQTLDHALRSFLKVVVLIGETQERERVLQQFACRFHQCNPDSFSSSGAVLALTCALMLLNTDLHGQNVGKSMSSSKFVSNLEGMNEGENFSKDFLKSVYNSIKSERLEWAVDEEELKSSVLADEDAGEDVQLRSKANPFQDVPHNKTATVVKEGFLQRKLHADIDGKRTPWGKRSWKTFYGVLRGMVLYLQKDDCRKDQVTNEEVVSVHHSLAEQAAEYTKRPHVFRLQTADWRVFLFQTSTRAEMHSWINRINLVSALHSSPPFPAAVGSQRRFCRPILPASESVHTLESQLQSHAKMLESFKVDLSSLQQNLPEGKKAKAKELEEQRVRAEYLQHEVCRYEMYIQVLEAWKKVKASGDGVLTTEDLNPFDKAVSADSEGEEEGTLKKSYSSPSLEVELAPPTVIKVRRNISERRTYRRTIIPRWNKES